MLIGSLPELSKLFSNKSDNRAYNKHHKKSLTISDEGALDEHKFIADKIKIYYEIEEHNCAVSVLKVLAERYDFPIHQQVMDSALAQNGLGQSGAQCGLITGAAMFLGVVAVEQGWTKDTLHEHTQRLTTEFKNAFHALDCRSIRPEGFVADNPPHLCEPRTVEALEIMINYISRYEIF